MGKSSLKHGHEQKCMKYGIQYVLTKLSSITSSDLRMLKVLSENILVKMSAACSDDAQYCRSMTPSSTSPLM